MAKITMLVAFFAGLVGLFTNIDSVVDLYNKYLGEKNIEIVFTQEETDYQLQIGEKLSLEMTLRNTGKRDIGNIKLHSVAMNPQIVSVNLEDLTHLITLEAQTTHKIKMVVKAESKGESNISVQFIDKTLTTFSSQPIYVKVVEKSTESPALSVRYAHYFPSPYKYAFSIENGRLQKVRLLPQEKSYSEESFRDPIKMFFFNKSSNQINVDEIELLLNTYKEPPERIVIGYLEKGVFDKELFHVTLNPKKKTTPILRNKYIEIKPNQGQNIMIDFDSETPGYYNFNLKIDYYENDLKRAKNTENFELYYLNDELSKQAIHVHSFDENLAERILKTTSDAWGKIKSKKLSLDEILQILEEEEKKIQSTSTVISLLFGTGYLKDGRYEDAILYLTQYITKEPEELTGYVRLSDAYLFSGDHENALRVLFEAEKLDPTSPPIIYRISRIYESIGSTKEAIKYYHTLSEIVPDNPHPWYKLSDLYLQSDIKQSLNYAEKAIEVNPFYFAPYFTATIGYLRQSKPEEAWKNFLGFCLVYHMSSDGKSKDDITVIVQEKALETMNRFENIQNSDSSEEEILLSNFIKEKRKQIPEERIQKALALRYIEIQASNLSTNTSNAIKTKTIPEISLENQIKLIVNKKGNFDVLKGEFIISLKNISGVTLTDVELIPPDNNSIFKPLTHLELASDETYQIANITVAEILSMSEEEMQNQMNASNDIGEKLSINFSYIGNIAFGEGIRKYLNFSVKFNNTYFNTIMSIEFKVGKPSKIIYDNA